MTRPKPTPRGKLLLAVGSVAVLIAGYMLNARANSKSMSLPLPVNKLDREFLTHLHADHTGDVVTLVGSYAQVGRADGPIYLWGPSGTEPRLGTRHFVEAVEESLAWDTESGRGPINPDSMKKGSDQLPPLPGVPHVGDTPIQTAPPAWWAEAIIPVD
jgi:ribonuclease Z